MKEIIQILMRRDGMTYDEARCYLREVRDAIADSIDRQASPEEIDDLVMGELCLELDENLFN